MQNHYPMLVSFQNINQNRKTPHTKTHQIFWFFFFNMLQKRTIWDF